MFNTNEPLSDTMLDNTISEIDQRFRLNFSGLIKESKLNAHKCQYLCYKNKENLLEAESCARNCYKPILYSKKNISSLIENVKEAFEKCKFTAQSINKEQGLIRKEVLKCVNKYNIDLNGIKDEVEYIYKGYMKNFEVLLPKFENEGENKII